MIALIFISGILIGAAIGFILRSAKIAALNERVQNAQDQLVSANQTQQKIKDEFKLAAWDVLNQVKKEVTEDVSSQRTQITSSVEEMRAQLTDYQKLVRKFEDERSQVYGRLEKSLAQVFDAEQQLRSETGALKNVLTASTGIRGNFGQKLLQEILEQSDLVKGIHFEAQVSSTGEQGANRPDFVVKLPNNKKLVIDSKDVSGEYLLAQETTDPVRQKEHYEKLVANIRGNIKDLARKDYQTSLDPDIPFVVMFIPSEAAIRAAFTVDATLFQEASDKKVVLASPMTLLPLIFLIAHTWQQHQLTNHARDLSVAVEELGNSVAKFVSHLHGVQSGLQKAAEGWDKAVGSWQSRVIPKFKEIKNLGGRLKEVDGLDSVQTSLRPLEQNLLDTPSKR